ncbi:MAG: hypothetical protein AAF483_20835 [Planctomycetota bacterium]
MVALAVAPDGKSLLAGSQLGVHVLSWPELQVQKTIACEFPNVHHIEFSPEGKHFGVAGGEPALQGVVELFSWPECQSERVFLCHDDSAMQVVWLDEQHLASCSLDYGIAMLDRSQDEPASILRGHSRGVTALSYLPQKRLLVSSGLDQSLRVWNLAEQEVLRSLTNHKQPVRDLELRPNQEGLPMVASASLDRTVRLWQPSIGRLVRFARLPNRPVDIVWKPDGSRLYAACENGRVFVIDPDTVEVTELPNGTKSSANSSSRESRIYSLVVHPSGDLVIGGASGRLHRISLDRLDH